MRRCFYVMGNSTINFLVFSAYAALTLTICFRSFFPSFHKFLYGKTMNSTEITYRNR